MVRPGPTPQLSVVVPAYNDEAGLRRVLACLLNQSLAPAAYEVVVADDGSTDRTPEVVAAAGMGRVRVRAARLETNRGRSAARNAGIRAAEGAIVVFTDSDVLVRPDFLQRHLMIHRAAAGAAVGRGPVVPIPSPELPRSNPRVRLSPAYLDTANASVPRRALVEAGLFDEGFRVYGWEDFDLGLRLGARGIPRIFDREAIAFHVQPLPSAGSLERHFQKEEERARTALYLLRKHPGRQTRVLIQDTAWQRALHFMLGGAGLLTERTAPRLAAWLQARGFYALAGLVLRGVLNRHYLICLDRFRALQEGRR